jgi:hypothetical protein
MRIFKDMNQDYLCGWTSCFKHYFLNSYTHITVLWAIAMNTYDLCTITIKAPEFFGLERIHKTLNNMSSDLITVSGL